MQHINLCPVDGITTTPPDTTNVASKRKPVVVTSFEVSGTSWRRVYSDGWVEMGGYIEPVSVTAYGTVAVVFPWQFTEIPMFIKCQPVSTSTTSTINSLYGVKDVTVSGFTFQRGYSGTVTVGFYWVAKGL